jgi:hypothetical protein
MRAIRGWQWQQGWQAINADGNGEGDGNSNEGGR